MEEDMFHISNVRQTVDPRLDIINKTTEPLYKKAMQEFGFNMPLVFALYNQIRFYEDFGKLKVGFNVASPETLADQFGVTKAQIMKAYDHLTNRYKLGKWVENAEPIYRNVKKVWVSNERLNSPGWGEDLPSLGSITPLAGEKPPKELPLSESKKKVSESKNLISNDIKLVKPEEFGDPNINKCFDLWEQHVGYPVTSKKTLNRRAVHNLIKTHGLDGVEKLIRGVAVASSDRYAPQISDFIDLQSKLNNLLAWGKKRGSSEVRGVKI